MKKVEHGSNRAEATKLLNAAYAEIKQKLKAHLHRLFQLKRNRSAARFQVVTLA